MLSKDFMMKTIDKNLTKNYNIIIVNLDGLRRDKVHLVKSLNDLTNQSFFFQKYRYSITLHICIYTFYYDRSLSIKTRSGRIL